MSHSGKGWNGFFFYLDQVNAISANGRIQSADQPSLLASNRGFRYGESLFETMKVSKGRIRLAGYHFDRLFASLAVLNYEFASTFTPQNLSRQILDLCQLNKCEDLARVRLTVFAGNGDLYANDRGIQYIIESNFLDDSFSRFNEEGWTIDVFTQASKLHADPYSNLKSAGFLVYAQAARYARAHQFQDCLVLNSEGRIADSTMANVFLIMGGHIVTPPLEEGCVNGVTRRFLLEQLGNWGYTCIERSISIHELAEADEIFLSNAIRGIRWVNSLHNNQYGCQEAKKIYALLEKNL